jgi:hypothetical protein
MTINVQESDKPDHLSSSTLSGLEWNDAKAVRTLERQQRRSERTVINRRWVGFRERDALLTVRAGDDATRRGSFLLGAATFKPFEQSLKMTDVSPVFGCWIGHGPQASIGAAHPLYRFALFCVCRRRRWPSEPHQSRRFAHDDTD